MRNVGSNQRTRFGRKYPSNALNHERSATIRADPMAIHTKKKTSRFQADRVSRSAISTTNLI